MKTRKFEKKNYVKELVALMRSTLPEKELAKRIDNYHYNDIAIFRYGGIISGGNVWISSGSGNILRTGFNIPYKYF